MTLEDRYKYCEAKSTVLFVKKHDWCVCFCVLVMQVPVFNKIWEVPQRLVVWLGVPENFRRWSLVEGNASLSVCTWRVYGGHSFFIYLPLSIKQTALLQAVLLPKAVLIKNPKQQDQTTMHGQKTSQSRIQSQRSVAGIESQFWVTYGCHMAIFLYSNPFFPMYHQAWIIVQHGLHNYNVIISPFLFGLEKVNFIFAIKNPSH